MFPCCSIYTIIALFASNATQRFRSTELRIDVLQNAEHNIVDASPSAVTRHSHFEATLIQGRTATPKELL